ncbi:4-coumarate:coa ligase-like protein [Angomonas deanei]|uniref:AMP-binding enzyme/AMP-binding enzyme C-terminal domain containing protein, putative n=1 Tax=Angomonas deanei TaxID=59799 RepID=A0A7G2CFC8_9TRYP|nr:4-coumarate:coa ligase-like protein [Angomonas deanei]CAD2217584.1 AMP-binding enzyme/AMP-binding enzyme C-terminal domain containing protein, putative [Angomonas deanei]|eukprot:EPY32065.1 4-coumarate:coa ligase-like protein [Angomonas deanei]
MFHSLRRLPVLRQPHGLVRSSFFAAGTLVTSTRHACTMRDGQRIYTSNYPSVQSKVEKEKTLYHYMWRRMKEHDKHKLAAVQAESGQSMTYPQLMMVSEYMSQVLYHTYQIRKGDVVMLSMLNTIVFSPSVFGTLRLGAITSTVNAVADPPTLAYHLKASNAKILIGMRYFQKQLETGVALCKKETGRDIPILYPEDVLKMSFWTKIRLFLNLPSKWNIPASYKPLENATLDDTIYIPFSSGTTGLPKGVQLTNRNLISNCEQVISIHGIRGDDVSICVLPFFHIFGFSCSLTATLAGGGTQIIMVKFSLDKYIEMWKQYKATVNLVAPPIVVTLMKNKERLAAMGKSIRTIRSGAAPLSAEMEKELEAVFPGCSVGQGYGMTEMSPVVTAVPADVTEDNRVHGSCGKLVPDTEIRIVKVDDTQQSGDDKSAGVDAAEGEEGEIWTRGPQMMKGYLNQEDTDKCMQNGWFRTGDVARIDPKTEDLIITDRLKELIKYKGFQVSPAQMEGVILQHPKVQDCVVIGVNDPRNVSFEYAKALIILKPEVPAEEKSKVALDVIHFVRNKMPPHKRLHGGVRVVDEIPRNASGKPLRRTARQEEAQRLQGKVRQD